MRSLLVQDFIDIQHFFDVPIGNGDFAGIGTEPHSLNLLVFANYMVTTPVSTTPPSTTVSPDAESEGDDSNIQVASVPVFSATVQVVPLVSVPFWLIVIPFTLLSVYLMLRKPRKRGGK